MQCTRTISFAQATYTKCPRTTDCNLVCSLEQESHTAPFMLSIHSPDNVFMVLVSIFISNRNHFCVLCFRLAAARATTALWRIEILNTIRSWRTYGRTHVRTVVRTYVRSYARTYGRTTPSLCLGTPVPWQNRIELSHGLLCDHCTLMPFHFYIIWYASGTYN